MPLAPGTRLGPYEILSQLGAGGMGEVYRARDSRLERDVAIKVLPAHLAKDPEALARFEREAKAVAALSHPNILAIHDFGHDQGLSYAVTELLEGETIRGRLAESPIPWRKAVEIGVAVAEGLSAAHAKNIIHRDLKPENIFLTSDARVKILDFGLARVGAVFSNTPATADAVTQPGTIMGTVDYMSPEQVRGSVAEATSDIFSLGAVLYEMICGQKAFSRGSAPETMSAILHEEPRQITRSGKSIPLELERVIHHCLEKNPQERFQSARDFAFALKATLTESGISRAAAAPRARKSIDSLAVLPFANAGGDSNLDYLSDGITENLINNLSQLPKLRVVPRSIAFRYKGRDIDPQMVGRELGVRALLTGRVALRGDMLNIQTELVNVDEQSQLWGQQYNRKLSDIFAVQEEISSEICEKLRVRLSGEQKKRLAKRSTENTEAYQLYLKGRYYWNRRAPDRVQKGIEYFQQAIDKDPTFAPAYAGLADSYGTLSMYGALPPRQSFPRQKAAAARALELDDKLAEAYASLGYATAFYDWDWSGAEKLFQRAIDVKEKCSSAYHSYAVLLCVVGRFQEAIAAAKRAQESEPLSLAISSGVALAFHCAREYDRSIEESQKTIDLDPTFGTAYYCIGLAHEQKGMLEQATADFEKAVSLLPGTPRANAALGHAHAIAGRTSEARKILNDLKELSKQRYVAPLDLAPVCAGLGGIDEAFEWIDKGCEDRSLWLGWMNPDPRSDCLRSDPRFQAFLRRIGLAG